MQKRERVYRVPQNPVGNSKLLRQDLDRMPYHPPAQPG